MASSKIEERAKAIKCIIEDVYKANGLDNAQASAIYRDESGKEILITPYRYADPAQVTVYHNGNVGIILRNSFLALANLLFTVPCEIFSITAISATEYS